MYHMMNNGPGVSSVTVLVRGMTGNNDILLNKSTVFNVVAQSAGQTLYGAKHIGNHSNWNDSFAINMKDLQHDDLTLIAFINDHEHGKANVSLMDIVNSGTHQKAYQYELRDPANRNVIGYLNVDFQPQAKENIVGGLHPPRVTLKSGHDYVQDTFIQRGIEKNLATKLNLFSCMDASDMGWQPYPYKFQSRLRTQYDISHHS